MFEKKTRAAFGILNRKCNGKTQLFFWLRRTEEKRSEALFWKSMNFESNDRHLGKAYATERLFLLPTVEDWNRPNFQLTTTVFDDVTLMTWRSSPVKQTPSQWSTFSNIRTQSISISLIISSEQAMKLLNAAEFQLRGDRYRDLPSRFKWFTLPTQRGLATGNFRFH